VIHTQSVKTPTKYIFQCATPEGLGISWRSCCTSDTCCKRKRGRSCAVGVHVRTRRKDGMLADRSTVSSAQGLRKNYGKIDHLLGSATSSNMQGVSWPLKCVSSPLVQSNVQFILQGGKQSTRHNNEEQAFLIAVETILRDKPTR